MPAGRGGWALSVIYSHLWAFYGTSLGQCAELKPGTAHKAEIHCHLAPRKTHKLLNMGGGRGSWGQWVVTWPLPCFSLPFLSCLCYPLTISGRGRKGRESMPKNSPHPNPEWQPSKIEDVSSACQRKSKHEFILQNGKITNWGIQSRSQLRSLNGVLSKWAIWYL